jgi:hypothetical protein
MSSRSIAGVIAAAVAAATLTATAHAQSVRTADSLLHQGILQRAEAEYYAASRVRPRDPVGRSALGKYLLDRGAFRIGATLIDEAMQFGFDKIAGTAMLARVYMNLGEYGAIERLPAASTLPSDEQALVRWLVAHPSGIDSSESAMLVAFTRGATPGVIGAIRLRVNGQPLVALISPRSNCGLRIADTSIVASTLHRFGSSNASDVSLAAADSIGFGRFVLRNFPDQIERMHESAQAVICFGTLARFAPTFDPRANLVTLHVNGAVSPPSSTSSVAQILDVDGQYTLLRSGVWSPIGSPDITALLADRRWTFDPRRRQVTIEP